MNRAFWQKIILILFGIFLTLLFLEIGLRSGGYILSSLQEGRNRALLHKKGAYRIMCLGESTTVSPYPALLQEILNQRNTGIRFTVINKGVAGTNTSEILARLEGYISNYQPDMVITMMGLNDEGRHIPYVSGGNSNYAKFFTSLKLYKLFCLLQANLSNKIQEVGINKKISKDTPLSVASIKDGNAEEDALKQAITANPSDDYAYAMLAHFYRIHNREAEAAELFEKALGLNPNNFWYYSSLGYIYSYQKDKLDLAEAMLKKATELSPRSGGAYFDLGLYVYKRQNRLLQAEEAFQSAIAVDPKYCWAYLELADCYKKQGKIKEGEGLLRHAIEVDPDNTDRYYSALSGILGYSAAMGGRDEYYKKTGQPRKEKYNPITRNNYLRLKEALDKHKIKFICVQYPMRSVESLKRIFQDTSGTTFVDNEKIFKEAVEKEGYDKYFTDMIGGDFGHCTREGYKLLADNIANAILGKIPRP